MKGKDLLEGMGFVDANLVEEAAQPNTAGEKIISIRRRWSMAAAASAVFFMMTVPALAANVPIFYEVLYRISPATAQYFKPIQMACEDNGIRMEVTAAFIHEDTAEIYITMQDLTGDRFDGTIDLFDSYDIHMPFDSSGTCRLAEYDDKTQTATFLIQIQLWEGQKIEGDKITFSISELLLNKQKWEGVIEGVDLTAANENPETQRVHTRGMGGYEIIKRYRDVERDEGIDVMKPGEAIVSPTPGVAVTGIGYVDGELRVQVYYEDIRRTDNHGFVCLRNRKTDEKVYGVGSISYFDAEYKGSYDEEIFGSISPDMLGEYGLYGSFTTSDDLIEGDWEVTFPLGDI